MNQDKLKLWIDALRSGEYRQARETLTRVAGDGSMSHCCLGVACEVAIKDGLDLQVHDVIMGGPQDHRRYGRLGETGFMPEEVRGWLGAAGTNVLVNVPESEGNGGTQYVAHLNDADNWTFEQIADALEQTFKEEK